MLQAAGKTLADLSSLGRRAAVLLARIRTRQVSQFDALQGLLEVVGSMRVGLFSFADVDRYTLAVTNCVAKSCTLLRAQRMARCPVGTAYSHWVKGMSARPLSRIR